MHFRYFCINLWIDTKYLLVTTLPSTKISFGLRHELIMFRNVVIKEGGRHLDITLIIFIYNIRLMKFVALSFS